jgi:MFS family permease
MALLGGAWIPMWFFLNLYLQQILGFDALKGGLALLPMTVLIMLLMVGITARLVARFGFKSTLTVGLVILAGATALLAHAPVGGSFAGDVLPASLIAALGMSLSYITAMMAAMSGAKPEEAGLASGLLNTSYQIGSAIGLAVMTAIATATTGSDASGLNAGFHGAFIGGALVAAAAAVAALTLVHQNRTPVAESSTDDQPAARRAG